MKQTKYNEIVVDENDLVELMLQDIQPLVITTYDTASIETYNELCELFDYGKIISFETPATTDDKYNATLVENWNMPDEYKTFNLHGFLMGQCATNEQIQRMNDEFVEYKERGLLPLLRYMKYIVDIMRENDIVWGVGRGSSVASYVLYLIGVHKIDSIKYDLDFKEFFR